MTTMTMAVRSGMSFAPGVKTVGDAFSGFATRGFLAAGAKDKTWFAIPDSVRALARKWEASNPGVTKLLDQIEGRMMAANAFLSRADATDAEKLAYLERFAGNADGEIDDEDNPSSLGKIFAAVMFGGQEALENVGIRPDRGGPKLNPTEWSKIYAKSIEEEEKLTKSFGLTRKDVNVAARAIFDADRAARRKLEENPLRDQFS